MEVFSSIWILVIVFLFLFLISCRYMSTIHLSPSLFPSLPLSVSQSLDELKIDTLKDVFHKITSIRNFTGIRNRTPESYIRSILMKHTKRFMVSTGAARKKFVNEITWIFYMWINDKPLKNAAVKMVHVIPSKTLAIL